MHFKLLDATCIIWKLKSFESMESIVGIDSVYSKSSLQTVQAVASLWFELEIQADYRRAGAPPASKKKVAPARRRRAV